VRRTQPEPEPGPARDIGPFNDADQAMNQYLALTYGFPLGAHENGARMVVAEGALIAGLRLTDYEAGLLAHLSPLQAVVVAGLLIRARHTAPEQGGRP
jgi:hypothetical protein